MVKQTIAVDIDDVLAQNAAGFTKYSNATWGTALLEEDYDDDWSTMWHISQPEIERRADVLLRDAPKAYRPVDGALRVLRRLQNDYLLIAVTSRRSWMRLDTKRWLDTHYPDIFDNKTLHFAGIWDQDVSVDRLNQSKGDIIDRLGADFLIDDQLKHCIAVAQRGKQAVLFGDYRWNQVPTLPLSIRRACSWDEVERYFYDQA